MGAAGARAPVGVADLGIVLARVPPMPAACHGLWLGGVCGLWLGGVCGLWLGGKGGRSWVCGLWLGGVCGLPGCNVRGAAHGYAVLVGVIFRLIVWLCRWN